MIDANDSGAGGTHAAPISGDNSTTPPDAPPMGVDAYTRATENLARPRVPGSEIWGRFAGWLTALASARRQIAAGGQRTLQTARASTGTRTPLPAPLRALSSALPWARTSGALAWRSAQRTSYAAALNDLGPSYSAARRWSPLWAPVVLGGVPLTVALILYTHHLGHFTVSSIQIETLAVAMLVLGLAFGALLRLATNDTVWTAVAALGLATYAVVTAFALGGPVAGVIVAVALAVAGVVLVRQRLHPVMEGTVDITTLFGKYSRTLLPGLNVLLPGERVLAVLNTHPRHYTTPPQRVRTPSGAEAHAMASIAYQLVPEEAHRAVTEARNWELNLRHTLVTTLQDELACWRPDAADDEAASTSGDASSDASSDAPRAATPATDAQRLTARVERRMRDYLLGLGVRVTGIQLSNVDLPSDARAPASGSPAASPLGSPWQPAAAPGRPAAPVGVESLLARLARAPGHQPNPASPPAPGPQLQRSPSLPSPLSTPRPPDRVTVSSPAGTAGPRPASPPTPSYPIPPLPAPSPLGSPRPAPALPTPTGSSSASPAPQPTTAIAPPRRAAGAAGALGRELARFARPAAGARRATPPLWPVADPAAESDDEDDDTGRPSGLLRRLASLAGDWLPSRTATEASESNSSQPLMPPPATPSRQAPPRQAPARGPAARAGAGTPADLDPAMPVVPSPAVLAAMYDEIREGHITDPTTVRGIAQAFERYAQDGESDAGSDAESELDAGAAARALHEYAQELADRHGLGTSPDYDDQDDDSEPYPRTHGGSIPRPERDENLTAGG